MNAIFSPPATRPCAGRSGREACVLRGAVAIAAVAACLVGGRADAATRFWSDTGTWNAPNATWGTVSGGPYTSTWSNSAPDAATFEGTAGSQTWEIDYDRTSSAGLDNFTADYLPSGSFVVLTAVPEPSTYAMALAGLACGGFSAWRRRQRA